MADFRLQGRYVEADRVVHDTNSGCDHDFSAAYALGENPDWWPLISPARGGVDDFKPRVLLVRQHPQSERPALAAPASIEKFPLSNCYSDFYRPIAPEGFVALGDFFGEWPPTMHCVADDCARRAPIGEWLWDDRGGSSPVDYSVWAVEGSAHDGWSAFVVHKSWDRPSGEAWLLDMDRVEMV